MLSAQDIIASKDLAEALSYWATAAGIVVGIGAIASYIWDKRLHRWGQARELYSSFQQLSFQHPHLSADFWRSQTKTEAERHQYEVFVGIMLWSIEEILTLDKRPAWLVALKSDLRRHVGYLSDSVFLESEIEGYFPPMKKMILEVVAEETGSKGGGDANA